MHCERCVHVIELIVIVADDVVEDVNVVDDGFQHNSNYDSRLDLYEHFHDKNTIHGKLSIFEIEHV